MIKYYDTPPKPDYCKCATRSVPLYPCTLYIGVTDNMEDSSLGYTVNHDGKIYVILDVEYAIDVSIIAHESFHVLDHIAKYTGLVLEGETGAYLLEWIVKTIFDVTKNHKLVKNYKPNKKEAQK